MMRILLAVVVAMVVAVCAYAQPNVGNMQGGSGPPKSEPVYHVDEKDYKRALKHVPDSTAKFDPWGGVRETPEAPKSKKKEVSKSKK